MNKYFVYVDSKPDGTPFYVGKGERKRVYQKARNNEHHARICAKYPDWTRGIAYFGDESGAIKKEKELIALFGRVNSGNGTLCNKTDGGEGVSGMKSPLKNIPRPQEVKLKISQSNLGKTFTQEHKLNLSLSHLGQKAWNKGKEPSLQTKAKISLAQIGKKLTESTKDKVKFKMIEINKNPSVIAHKSMMNKRKFICLECGKISNKQWISIHQTKDNHIGNVEL